MAIRGVLLDLEGVLYEGDRAIPGAVAAVRRLESAGLALRYLTNTTTRSRRDIVAHLEAIGVPCKTEHVFSPAAAAVVLLKADGVKRVHLATTEFLAQDFVDFEHVDTKPQAIILGDLYHGFNWARLNELFQMLLDDARLIALHRNRYCRREEGISLDLGPFVAALEYVSGKTATVVGKPSKPFFNLALDDLGLDSHEVVMVGDDIEADIGGAQAAGLLAVQVRTGKYTARDLRHPTVRPDAVLDSVAALPTLLDSFDRPTADEA
jgi:HAD superfamily hydrolase (TIGR01458 family)